MDPQHAMWGAPNGETHKIHSAHSCANPTTRPALKGTASLLLRAPPHKAGIVWLPPADRLISVVVQYVDIASPYPCHEVRHALLPQVRHLGELMVDVCGCYTHVAGLRRAPLNAQMCMHVAPRFRGWHLSVQATAGLRLHSPQGWHNSR